MDSLMELLGFAGKVVLITFAIGILLILIANIIVKIKHLKSPLEVEDLSKKMKSYSDVIRPVTGDAKILKKEFKKRKKLEKKSKDGSKKHLYVIDFEGDIKASQVESLSEKITALLTVTNKSTDEVLVRLESPGGMVHTYGLAAAQLLRIKQAGLKYNVCVDKVAASGGYLMACTADKIYAAPFAVLGSIGVLAQIPNFHRWLKKNDVDYKEFTAGEFKRTVTMFGEITEKGVHKLSEDLEETHHLFKSFVGQHRPHIDLNKVATGEHWYGVKAKELQLVDEIQTSADFLFHRRNDYQIIKIDVPEKKKFSDKLAGLVGQSAENLWMRLWQKSFEKNILNS